MIAVRKTGDPRIEEGLRFANPPDGLRAGDGSTIHGLSRELTAG
jgi:hypothetical protein